MNKITYIFRCTTSDTGHTLYFSTLKTAQAYITATSAAIHTDPAAFSMVINRVDSRHQAFDAMPWEVKSPCNYSFSCWLELGQPSTDEETAAALAEKVTA